MASVKTLFQLSTQPTWFENIAVRKNGTLLVTRIDVPELWEVDPKTGIGKSILSVPKIMGLTGVNELMPDVFALGGGDYDFAAGRHVPGSNGLWVADLRGEEPHLRLVVMIPEIGLLNGTATWDEKTVLAADSVEGKIYKIDVETGAYSVCLDDETLKIADGAPTPLGVNGVKVHDGHVYFSNTTRQLFCRVPVDKDIKATGPVEVFASGFAQDDFCIAEDGTAYVTTHPTNMVMKVPPGGGEAVLLAGAYTSMEVASGTACALGRTDEDKDVLYVCTSGAIILPVNGETEPAKVVAIKLDA
jgi:sugar lactone lactonase YvrE